MKKLIITLLLIFTAQTAIAGCPVNELIYNTLTPVTFSFEKRNGTGEDTANTANKKISLSYWNGTAWRWVGADNLWDDTTETQLAMTQLTGSQYYFNIPAAALSSTVLNKYIVMRFDETDDVDVTMSCVAYVQPEDRLIVGDNMNLANDAITAAKIAAGAFGLSEVGSTSGTVTTGSCDPNTTLTFDTDMTQAGVNHWKDAFITFKDDTTTTELQGQTKVITSSAVNGCITVRGGFTTAPASGDTFVIINK